MVACLLPSTVLRTEISYLNVAFIQNDNCMVVPVKSCQTPHLFWSPMPVPLIYTSVTVPSPPPVPTRLDLINDLALCCHLASHGVVTTLPVGRVDGGGGQLDHQVHEEGGEARVMWS